MPSPRPSGSGVWKILVLPHCLQYEVLYLVTFPSYSSEPDVGPFDGGLIYRFFRRGSGLGLAFLWAVATNVPLLVTIITRHLGQPSLAHLLLSPVVPFTWFEGRSRRVVDFQSSILFLSSSLDFSLVGIVVKNVFGAR